MTVTVKPLVAAKYAESVQTTQYAATNCKAIIDKATITNTSAANATFSVNLVPNGGTVGASNLVVDTRTIVPDECYTLPELVGHVLEPSGSISTLASAASALVLRISGREIT